MGTVAVTEQEDLGVPDLLGGSVSVARNLIEALTLFGGQPDGVFLGSEHEAGPSLRRDVKPRVQVRTVNTTIIEWKLH
jgi:hypothetical protein